RAPPTPRARASRRGSSRRKQAGCPPERRATRAGSTATGGTARTRPGFFPSGSQRQPRVSPQNASFFEPECGTGGHGHGTRKRGALVSRARGANIRRGAVGSGQRSPRRGRRRGRRAVGAGARLEAAPRGVGVGHVLPAEQLEPLRGELSPELRP